MAEFRRNGDGDDEEDANGIKDHDHSILYYCLSDLPKLLAAGRKGGHTFPVVKGWTYGKRGKFLDLWVRILKMKCWEFINQEGFSISNGKCSNPIKIVRIIEGFSPTKNRFFFEEVASLESRKGKILCCHFSSDGKLLASAGDDKKVFSVGHD